MTIYFSRGPLDGSTPIHLYSGTRAASTGPFTGIAPLNGTATAGGEDRPTLTADGLTMLMTIFTDSGLGIDMAVATRTSAAATFSMPVPVAAINTAALDLSPWISEDGLTLYFSSSRAGSPDIFKATRANTSGPFGAPVSVGELNTNAEEYAPVLSKDGLEIFFASTRDQDGMTPAREDIFHATRSTPSDGFGAPALVTELSGPTSYDSPSWVSPDRCRLMFTSDRTDGNGGSDIWIATRP